MLYKHKDQSSDSQNPWRVRYSCVHPGAHLARWEALTENPQQLTQQVAGADAAVSGRRPGLSKQVEDGPSRLPSRLHVNSHLNVPVLLAFSFCFGNHKTAERTVQRPAAVLRLSPACAAVSEPPNLCKLQRKHTHKF